MTEDEVPDQWTYVKALETDFLLHDL